MNRTEKENIPTDVSQTDKNRNDNDPACSTLKSIILFLCDKYGVILLVFFLISLPFTKYSGPFHIKPLHKFSAWLIFGFLATIIAHCYNKYPRKLATIGAFIYSTSLLTYQENQPLRFASFQVLSALIFMLGFFFRLKNIPAAMVMAVPVIISSTSWFFPKGLLGLLFEFVLLLVCSYVISVRNNKEVQANREGDKNE